MLKTPVKFFISISLLILLMSGNSIAFHKEGNSETDIPEIEGIKKKDIQSKYCSAQVVKYTKAPENLKKEKETAEDKSEEQKTKIAEEKFYKVISYHSEEKINTSKELDFSVLKNKINKKRYIGPISSIEALLNYYCVQEIPLDGKIKIYKKGDVKLYDEIAIINGYPDRKAELEGSIYDTGKINLTIEGKSLIYSKAQFIFKEEKRLKAKEIKDEAERVAKETEDEAERVAGEKKAEAERDWIARNKPTFIGKIDLKIKNFDDQIIKYNNSVNALAISHENFTKYFNEKFNEVEDLLDLVDVGQKEIKDKAIELKKVKREYLNKKILENIELKFKNIKKKKSKNFKVYKEIQVLYDEAYDSKKQKHFEKGYRSKFWTKKMPGFFVQWDRISKNDLGIKKYFQAIEKLTSEINTTEANIVEKVDILKVEIETLEEELANKWPIMEIVIGIIIFLVICIGGYFIYDTGQKRKKEQENADSKIASLKDDFEGKLKDTTEQIKSENRTAARSQQVQTGTPEVKPSVVQSKTPDEVIADKYDELVSDYKDALDDFSKVSAFKQKWHGLALSRKERQDGTKTILINSTRAFEKAEIWCVTFSEKYFAFPGSSVKTNMATYMNLDFEKAGRDFKGVFAISSGSNYTAEAAVLRRGGAGFVVERIGKIIFPN